MRLLLCEDDDQLARGLCRALRRAGHTVVRAAGLADALESLREQTPDIALIDLSLPDGHGSRLVSALAEQPQVGIIIVTAHGDERSRVMGLRAGADDYVVKPFSVAELLARITALGRRTRQAEERSEEIVRGVHSLAPDSRTLRTPDSAVSLTGKECAILALLMARDSAVPRSEFVERLWPGAVSSRSLDTHIASLRAKLPAGLSIVTVHGLGYALADEAVGA